jgi:hypothetical protein
MMQFKNIARFFHNIFSLNFKPRLLCLGFFLYSSLIFPDVSLDQLSQSYDLESISNSFTWSRLMDLKNLDKNNKRSFFIYDHGEGFDPLLVKIKSILLTFNAGFLQELYIFSLLFMKFPI